MCQILQISMLSSNSQLVHLLGCESQPTLTENCKPTIFLYVKTNSEPRFFDPGERIIHKKSELFPQKNLWEFIHEHKKATLGESSTRLMTQRGQEQQFQVSRKDSFLMNRLYYPILFYMDTWWRADQGKGEEGVCPCITKQDATGSELCTNAFFMGEATRLSQYLFLCYRQEKYIKKILSILRKTFS